MPVVKYVLEGDASGLTKAFKAGTVAAVALASAYGVLLEKTVATVDKVNTLSKATGLSTDAINGLRLAADASGKALEDVVPTKLAKNLVSASQGATDMQKSFKAAGIDIDFAAGEVGDVNDILPQLVDNLQNMEDKTLAAGLAAQVMGKQGRELLTAFDGQEGFERFVELAREFGTKTGPDAVEAASAWQAATADLNLALEDTGATLIDVTGGTAAWAETVGALSLGVIFVNELFSDFAGSALENVHTVAGAFAALQEGNLRGAADIARNFNGLGEAATGAYDAAFEKAQKFFELQNQIREKGEEDEEDEEDATKRRTAAVDDLNEAMVELVGTVSLLELGQLSGAQAASAYALELNASTAGLVDLQNELDSTLERMENNRQAFQQLGGAITGAVDDSLEALRALGKEGGAAYAALFAIQKAAAIASIIVSTATGVAAALELGPAGIPLGVTIAAAGAAQLATVVATAIGSGGSTTAPSGGTTGGGGTQGTGQASDMRDRAKQGADPRASAYLDAARAASGGANVTLQFRHELFEATVPDSANIPGSALNALRKNGVRVGHRGFSISPRKLLT